MAQPNRAAEACNKGQHSCIFGFLEAPLINQVLWGVTLLLTGMFSVLRRSLYLPWTSASVRLCPQGSLVGVEFCKAHRENPHGSRVFSFEADLHFHLGGKLGTETTGSALRNGPGRRPGAVAIDLPA